MKPFRGDNPGSDLVINSVELGLNALDTFMDNLTSCTTIFVKIENSQLQPDVQWKKLREVSGSNEAGKQMKFYIH